ncbi:MAG TPA: arginine--tRNA ligase [Chitinivibrionales bacterium]|nr:arginine--tRNA ligase [Chitinivibrionales bacterium]
MSESVYRHLSRSLKSAIDKAYGGAAGGLDISIEKPKTKSYGDLSSPVALGLAKVVKESPPVVAKKIMAGFSWDDAFVRPDPGLKSTVTGGFINFRLSAAFLHSVLHEAVSSPQAFGRNQADPAKRMLFEFVSANPTGPMVVVNGRAAAIGDTVARVNAWIGNAVEREYYVNDHGNQVELLGKSILCRFKQASGQDRPIPEGGYEGDYIRELAIEISQVHPEVGRMEDGEAAALFTREALERIMAQQKDILEHYGVTYDRWFRESELHKSDAPSRTLGLLESKGLVEVKDGAKWFTAAQFGDEKDRVLVRQDGSPTYFLADLSYHLHKASRGYDESCTFWGPDHHGYLPRLEAAVKVLAPGATVFRNFIIQQVNLIRDGKPFKMSKRKGDFITISDLLDEVGVDAARYFFLMRRLSSHFDFDMSLAVKKSDENPVYYVQYAHARTCSLLVHARQQGFTDEEIAAASPALLAAAEELDLMKRIAEFPTLLVQTALAVEPQRIPAFLEAFAAEFHVFYQKHRIVTEDRPLSCARLLLTCGVRNVIRLGLDLLGVSAPERM